MKTTYYLVAAAALAVAGLTVYAQLPDRNGPPPASSITAVAPIDVPRLALPPITVPPDEPVAPEGAAKPSELPALSSVAVTQPVAPQVPAVPVGYSEPAVPALPPVPAADPVVPALPAAPLALPPVPSSTPAVPVGPPSLPAPPVGVEVPPVVPVVPVPVEAPAKPVAPVVPPVTAPKPAEGPTKPVAPVTAPKPAEETAKPTALVVPPVTVPKPVPAEAPAKPAAPVAPPVTALKPMPPSLPAPAPVAEPAPAALAPSVTDASTRTQAAPLPGTKYVVMKGDKIIEGTVSLRGDEVIVREGAIDRPFAKSQVQFVADSKDDVYQFMLAKVSASDAAARLKVARWCMLSGLREQALTEAREVQKLKPNSSDAADLVRSLELSLQQFPPEGAPKMTAPVAPTLPAELSGRPVVPVTEPEPEVAPEVLNLFATKVQPILANQCAECHAKPTHTGAFKLVNVAPGEIGHRGTKPNLRAVAAQVRKDDLAASPLLVHSLAAHGGQKKPSFASHQAVAYRTLEAWAALTVGTPIANRPSVTPAAPAVPVTVPGAPGALAAPSVVEVTPLPPVSVPLPDVTAAPAIPAAPVVPAPRTEPVLPPVDVAPPALPALPTASPSVPVVPVAPSVPVVPAPVSLPPLPGAPPALPEVPTVPVVPAPSAAPAAPAIPTIPATDPLLPAVPPPGLPVPKPAVPAIPPASATAPAPLPPVQPASGSGFGAALPPKSPVTGPAGDEFDPAGFNKTLPK